MFFKANCKCGELWLSETYGGYDTVCNKTGRMCPNVRWNEENQEYIIVYEKFCQKHLSMKTPVELFGVECGKGWHPLIEPIFNFVDEYNSSRVEAEHITVTQVKEKWGVLHFHVEGATHELDRMIDHAEKLSAITCEECGNPGSLKKVNGWYRTLCGSCCKNQCIEETINGDVLTFQEHPEYKDEYVAKWRGYTVATAAVQEDGRVDITEWHPDQESTSYTSASNLDAAWWHIKNYTFMVFDDELKEMQETGKDMLR